jgi:hypothetical protein
MPPPAVREKDGGHREILLKARVYNFDVISAPFLEDLDLGRLTTHGKDLISTEFLVAYTVRRIKR